MRFDRPRRGDHPDGGDECPEGDKPAEAKRFLDPAELPGVVARIRKAMDEQARREDAATEPDPQGRTKIDRLLKLDSIRVDDDSRKHILDGDATGGGHRYGTGLPGRTEFPKDWDDQTIMDRVLDTAKNPTTVDYSEATRKRPEQWKCESQHDGTNVTAIVRGDGQVWTAWPTDGTGVHRNPWSKS